MSITIFNTNKTLQIEDDPRITLIINNLTIFFNPLIGKRVRLRSVWKNLWKLQILVLSRQESQRYLPMPNCKFLQIWTYFFKSNSKSQ